MKKLILFIMALILALSFAGCAKSSKNTAIKVETSKIGVMTGTTGESYALKEFPNASIEGFPSIMNAIAALKAGKVDTVVTADVSAAFVAKENSDLRALLDYRLTDEPICAAIAKDNTALLKQFDDIITLFKEDGTMDDMVERWIKTDSSPVEPVEVPLADGKVLKVGVSSTREPFDYLDGGKSVGLAPELALRIGEQLGRKVEFMDMDFSALIAALQSGKVDAVITLITTTPERAKAVNFTQDFYSSGQVFLTQKNTKLIMPDGTVSAYSEESESEAPPLQNSDFVGKKFAVVTGTMLDKIVSDNLGNNEILYFNSVQDGVEAVRNKKADATINDEPIMRKFVAQNPGMALVSPPLTQDEYGLVVSKDNPQLTAKLNEFYSIIKNDGTYDDMIARWVDNKDTPDMPAIELTPKNGTLKMATAAVTGPFSYYSGKGQVIGFDVEYARRFAKFMEMDIEIVDMDFGAIIASVQSGKTDFGSSLITITEERRKSIDFTEPYYIGGTSIAYLKNTVKAKVSFMEGVKNSFYNNLIADDRYKMVFEGLWVTILIAISALILGTILGFLICYLTMCKYKLLNVVAKIYTALLRGTPMVVMLMITFYIIFAKVDIDPIFVAIIAFGLNGGAFIGEIIRSAILTVDKGQIEAARSMGFSSAGAFFIVTLPQAVRVALPVYKSEFINIVKQTAIVGYIAIVDLTKVGDIIRSRTYDAFFPLIAVAVVYLITIGLFIFLFDTIHKRTDKRQRRA